MAPMECRNMCEEILCYCCVYTPAHVSLVVSVDFRITHGTYNITVHRLYQLISALHTVNTILQYTNLCCKMRKYLRTHGNGKKMNVNFHRQTVSESIESLWTQ